MSQQFTTSMRSSPQTGSEKPSLLIVDDDQDTCELICALLSRDYNCDTAHDGEQALNKLKANCYAAILVDLALPKLDGYAIMTSAAAMSPATPVIIVTATVSDLSKAMTKGAFDFIVKPFEPEQIEISVRRAVNLYTLSLAARSVD